MTSTLTRRWEAVVSRSSAHFTVRNLGVKTVTGTVAIREAWALVDGSGRPVSAGATLDLARLDTGNARRDRDLAAPRLLDTAQFPLLRFTGGAAEPDADGWRLPGVLEGHGARVDLVLAASVRTGGDEVVVRARTSFDRRELGVTAPRVLIGRLVDVSVEVVLRPTTG